MKKAFYIVLAFLLVNFLAPAFVLADWQGPNGAPPNNNRPAPLDISSTSQIKEGGLTVQGAGAFLQGIDVTNIGINNAVYGHGAGHGVVGLTTALNTYAGVYGQALNGGWAGYFAGPFGVTGNVYLGGNVGVGTTNPTTKLQAQGSVAPTPVGTESILSLIRQDSGAVWSEMASFNLGRHTSGGNAPYTRLDINLKNTSVNNGVANVNVMTLLDNGNVGIGIANPGAKLEVAGQIKITGGAPGAGKVLTSDGAGLATWAAGGGGGVWTTSGNNIYNNNADNVGIGTITPNTKLHISSPGTTELTITGASQDYINAGVVLAATDATNYRGLGIFMHDAGGDTEWYAGTPYAASDQYQIGRASSVASHAAATAQTGNAFITIKNSGMVGIGTTNPQAKLDVNGTANVNNMVALGRADLSVGAGQNLLYGNMDTGSTGNLLLLQTESVDKFKVDKYGNISVGTDRYGQQSYVKGFYVPSDYDGTNGCNDGQILKAYDNGDETFSWVCAADNVGGGVADGSITTVKLADNAVTNAKMADNAVTNVKIAAAAITGSKIAAGSINTTQLSDGAVTSAKISDNTIVNADINASAAIAGSKLADNSITSAKILDGTIVNADINASAAIALTKLASCANGQIPKYNNGWACAADADGSQNLLQVLQTGADASGFNTLTTIGGDIKIRNTDQNLIYFDPNTTQATDNSLYVNSSNNTGNFLKFEQGVGTVKFQVDKSGNATTTGNLTVKGNKIKKSDGGTVIQFDNGNVIIRLGN
ncbi:MAG: hypothetical protein NTZ18_02970 [Candidatus Komeilibacteria bacterium]|nr:hypothetical protein [Candidatus Komeilibacteria bacterium]